MPSLTIWPAVLSATSTRRIVCWKLLIEQHKPTNQTRIGGSIGFREVVQAMARGPRLEGEGQASTRDRWLEQHPELRLRIAAIDRELDPTPTIQERLRALQVEPPGRSRGLGLEL